MKIALLTALSLSAVTFGATAQDTFVPTQQQPSFSYVQAGYMTYDVSNALGDLDGLALRASYAFNEQVFATLDYEDLSGSANRAGFQASAEARELFLNLGYQFYQQGSTSLYVTGGLAWYEVDITQSFSGGSSERFSDDDTGFNVVLGARHRFNEHLEIDASIRHVDIGDGSDQAFNLSGRYYVTPRFSIDARYTRIDSDISGYSFGASYHF